MNFSTDFLTQLWQRLTIAKTPKFFNILTTSFLIAGALLATTLYAESWFTGQHQPVPVWLSAIEFILKGYLGASGILTAKATIKTGDTPPLKSDIEKPTLDSLSKELQDVKAQLAAAQQATQTPAQDTPTNPTV